MPEPAKILLGLEDIRKSLAAEGFARLRLASVVTFDPTT